jgi:hypothetical protein
MSQGTLDRLRSTTKTTNNGNHRLPSQPGFPLYLPRIPNIVAGHSTRASIAVFTPEVTKDSRRLSFLFVSSTQWDVPSR